jgi:hypothetical protein
VPCFYQEQILAILQLEELREHTSQSRLMSIVTWFLTLVEQIIQ